MLDQAKCVQELLVEVLREFLAALRLSMNETQQAVVIFETNMTDVLQQAFGSNAKASLPIEFPRLATAKCSVVCYITCMTCVTVCADMLIMQRSRHRESHIQWRQDKS